MLDVLDVSIIAILTEANITLGNNAVDTSMSNINGLRKCTR
jgi:hypothetical protein